MATLTIKNNKGTVTLGTYQTQSYGLDLTVTSEGATIYDGSIYYYFKYAGAGTYRGLALRTYETEPAAGVGIGELYRMDASATSVTFYVAEAEADIIRIDVKGKVAVVRGTACIVCGNSDYLMRFSFDEAWDAHDEKTARFVYRKLDGVHHFDKHFTGTDLFVPKLSGVDSVLVGVYAGDLVTTTPATIPCKRSILCDSGTVEGALVPSQYEELLAKYTALVYAQEELVVRVDAHEKRIANLEKGLSDDRYVTDDSAAYTKSIPVGACPFAAVEKVGGATKKSTNLLPYPYVDSTATVQGVTFTDNADGTITANGTPTDANAVFWLTNNLQLSAGTYRIVLREASESDGIILSIMKNGKWIADTASSYKIEIADGDIIRLYLQVPKGKNASNKTLMPRVNSGETVLPYEKYHEGVRSAKVAAIESKDASGNDLSRIDIPPEVQSLDGYGEGAGTASNGIVWREDGVFYEKKVHNIDLGTLDWEVSNTNRFVAYLPTDKIAKPTGSYKIAANAVCSKYDNLDQDTLYANKTGFAVQATAGTTVYVYDPTYTDASAFKSAMNGVILCYELETPEVVDISDLITADNLIEVEGGGALTFVNEHGAAAPSTIIYQVKGDT